MNAIEATLHKQVETNPTAMDGPHARLLARVVLAEREYTDGKYRPARDVIADLRAKNMVRLRSSK